MGYPPAPSPIARGGVMLLETSMALLLQAVFTTQPHSIPRHGSGEMEGPYVLRCSLYTAPLLSPCLAASHVAHKFLSCSSFIVPKV